MKKKLYQKIANFIIRRMKEAPSKKHVQLWFDIGMEFNGWCVAREIYLE